MPPLSGELLANTLLSAGARSLTAARLAMFPMPALTDRGLGKSLWTAALPMSRCWLQRAWPCGAGGNPDLAGLCFLAASIWIPCSWRPSVAAVSHLVPTRSKSHCPAQIPTCQGSSSHSPCKCSATVCATPCNATTKQQQLVSGYKKMPFTIPPQHL